MYSILLVEDEKTVLDGLCAVAARDEFGFDRVERARDGLEALAASRRRPFDVVVSDIKMPRMDGLELLESLRRESPHTQVILITAYGEFDYVLRALRLGAANFMMKPLNQNELIESIKAAIRAVQSGRREIVAPNEDAKAAQRYFLRRWLDGDMDDLELTMRAQLANVDLFLPEYNVVLFRPLTKTCERVGGMIGRALEARFSTWVCEHGGALVFVTGGHDVSPARVSRILSGVPEEAGDARLWLCAVGRGANRYQDVSLAFRLCARALDRPSSYMLGALCEAPETPATHGACEASSEDAASLLDEKSDERASERLARIGDTREALFPVMVAVTRELEERYPNEGERPGLLLQAMLEAWDDRDGRENVPHAAKTALLGARALQKRAAEGISPVVLRTLDIVGAQYDQTLTLKGLGEKLGVHPNYLGFLFKQETGVFFSDYLNRLRVRKAEALLLDSSDNVADVAARVGYPNVRYFNHAFKLQTGMSPGKFRMQGRLAP